MKIAIIDYGAGNIQSISFALERLGVHPVLSSEREEIEKADRVIFPGVGEAGSAMRKLKESGLKPVIAELEQPVLGICLGMQLLCNVTEEGDTPGLGVFDVDVVKFSGEVKVPQIGWNTVNDLKSPIFKRIAEGAHMYLVHSYYAPMCGDTIGTTTYGSDYSSALARDNFYGVQFHPEKSSKAGARLLENFLNL